MINLRVFKENSKCVVSSLKNKGDTYLWVPNTGVRHWKLQLFEHWNPVFKHILQVLQFLLIQHLQRSVFFDFFFFSLSLSPLSIPSSLEQGCFRFLLSPKPFSFGWSVKDSDNQRGEARRPAGEGAQEAGQIYWAASGRRTIRQGRAMPHSAGRSGKDFSLCLILM